MNYEEFNSKYPVGTKVIYTDSLGVKHETQTVGKARNLFDIDIVSVVPWEGRCDSGRSCPLSRIEVPEDECDYSDKNMKDYCINFYHWCDGRPKEDASDLFDQWQGLGFPRADK